MKRFILAAATVAVVLGAGAAMAVASGAPEINKAKASIQLQPAKFSIKRCAGEDGVTYVTYRGAWAGGETDLMAGSTDYNLTGQLTVKDIVWTINLKSRVGVLRGIAQLSGQPAAGGPEVKTYSGLLTLITEGLPADSSAAHATARGWINAATYTNGKADGGSLLANVEFQILPGFAANGEFGASMGLQDYSVADNNLAC
ncbi:MAG: hypothetical protein ACLQNG_00370 [Acidimicrobiales bacterium]|jgi:hypothetical protein